MIHCACQVCQARADHRICSCDGPRSQKRLLTNVSFGYDLICIAIGTSTGAIEINEQMPGWNKLVQALPKYLPGGRRYEEWFTQVAQPPFATNQTEIFRGTRGYRAHALARHTSCTP
jgi:hypothetical protein